MTSNSVIHPDQWYQPRQCAVYRQLRRWSRRVLKAALINNDMCLVFVSVNSLMVTFTRCFCSVTVCDRYHEVLQYSQLAGLGKHLPKQIKTRVRTLTDSSATFCTRAQWAVTTAKAKCEIAEHLSAGNLSLVQQVNCSCAIMFQHLKPVQHVDVWKL